MTKHNHNTLDTRHNKVYTSFVQSYDILDEKMRSLSNVSIEIEKYKSVGLSNLTDETFHDYINLVDEQRALASNIHHTKNKTSELDYMLDTADIIFKYYDILEKGNDNEPEANISKNSILKYFVDTSSNKPT
jgi:hypothetical protein